MVIRTGKGTLTMALTVFLCYGDATRRPRSQATRLSGHSLSEVCVWRVCRTT